jgi:hypothetical protein
MFGDIYSPVGEQLVLLGLILLGFFAIMYGGYKLATR